MVYTRRQILAQRAGNMRRNMTPCERKLWLEFLREYEIPFVAQKVIGNYIVDFYSRRVRLAIEIDGGQHFDLRQMRYDEVRSIYLETLEIKVLRFTNNDVKENFDGVCEVIHAEVTKRRHDLCCAPLDRLVCKL
ncbi:MULTISPECIES: endonuclease domain-containing protein [unclassified Adlercreutzia]|uniref:endonuclease domain-containing protein n=1 Tax=unclassified Adlercreutzia TaxID=2636013 RepID=UPI0013EAAC4E|nr:MULTISPECIES: endonuclease domain-containing protein [unclassified Adlercreutzia]